MGENIRFIMYIDRSGYYFFQMYILQSEVLCISQLFKDINMRVWISSGYFCFFFWVLGLVFFFDSYSCSLGQHVNAQLRHAMCTVQIT